MARKVEAVLAWLSDTPEAGPTPASAEFGTHLRAMLQGRFNDSDLTLVEHSNDLATKNRVLASLKAAVTNFKGSQDGLLVVGFSGHGAALGEEHLAWVLSDGMLPEEELRQALQPMPRGVEVVLVVDCCYALSVLPVSSGSKLMKPAAVATLRRIHQLQEQMLHNLSHPVMDEGKVAPRNVICIAAASDLLVRKNIEANYFARSLNQVVKKSLPPKYELIDEEMDSAMEALGDVDWIPESWWVVCQPPEAGKLPPFRQ